MNMVRPTNSATMLPPSMPLFARRDGLTMGSLVRRSMSTKMMSAIREVANSDRTEPLPQPQLSPSVRARRRAMTPMPNVTAPGTSRFPFLTYLGSWMRYAAATVRTTKKGTMTWKASVHLATEVM